MTRTITQQLLGLLFYKGEPVKKTTLATMLSIDVDQIQQHEDELKEMALQCGLMAVFADESIELRTHPELAETINEALKEERSSPLSKAALETLSIIAYTGGSTKAQIDYIRGVNATFILRNLLMRGLIVKTSNPNDKRSPLYVMTPDCLGYLGVSSVSDLPEYENVQEEITSLKNEAEEE